MHTTKMEPRATDKRWPEGVTTNLWPYAVRMANQVINDTPNMQDKSKRSPSGIFSNSNVDTNPKHWKPFGCPVYVLDNALQQGNIHHKWKERARVGVYLGRSPRHGRNVGLVLSLETGLVSPQFHIRYDSSFHTVKQESFKSQWHLKAGFVSRRGGNKRSRVENTVSQSEPKRPRVRFDQQQDQEASGQASTQMQHQQNKGRNEAPNK